MKKTLKLSMVVWAVSLGLGSCIDNKYDLDKDIDWTINPGGEHLTLPVGSTDTVFLSKIIELEEDGMLGVNGNHEYHLTEQGEVDVKPTYVSEVRVPEIESELASVKIVEGNAGRTGMPQENITAEVQTDGDFAATVTDIDEALKELGRLKSVEPSLLTLAFDFQSEGGLAYDKVVSGGLVFEFPAYIQFVEGQKYMQGNKLVLPEGFLLSEGTSARPVEIELLVSGYSFSDKAGGTGAKVPVNGEMNIDGKVTASGRVTTLNVKGESTATLSMLPKAVLAEMEVAHVTGIIKPAIRVDDTNIELSGLPDFLKDENTRLEFTNPVFVFKASNSLDTEVTADAVMTPVRGGKDLSQNKVTVAGLKVMPVSQGETLIALSRTGESGMDGVDNTKVEDINKLVEIIPDYIKLELKLYVDNDEYYEADLGVEYDMPGSYGVNVPLCFESGLTIAYKDSIGDLNNDLCDLDKVDFDVANLLFTAVNTVPLQMEVKPENVEIKDVNGNRIEHIKVTTEGRIAESKDGKAEVESGFTLKFVSDEPGVLSRVERICFGVTAVPGQATNVPLKDTQWLKMTKIRLNVPGGVKVDLN